MPFARDDLATITANLQAAVKSNLPGAQPLLPNNVLGILAKAWSEAVNSLYAYLDWVSLQAVPFTATGEAFYAWAALKGLYPDAATKATGSFAFPATGSPTILSGARITRADGVAYLTTADATATAGSVVAPVQAVLAGAGGTIANGVAAVLATPIAGVNSAAGVGAAGTAGSDAEAFDAFKTRALLAFAQPPQGGDFSDYVEWALAVPGVTRAWVQPLAMGAGTVSVYVMLDVTEAAYGGFPQGTNGVATNETRDTAATGDQLTVANALWPIRPVTALVYANAPGKNTVNLTIKLAGATTPVKSAIAAAAVALLTAKGTPGGVTLLPEQVALGLSAGVINLSDIEAAIAGVSGSAGFVITAVSCDHGSVSPGGDGNITSNTGYLPVLGTITWI